MSIQMPAIGQAMPALRHGMLSPMNKNHDNSSSKCFDSAQRSPREAQYASMTSFTIEQSPRMSQAGNRSRRNDLASQSVTVSSTRSVAMEVLGRVAPTHSRNMRGGSALEVRDIIDAGQKCSQKIGSTYVPKLQNQMSYTFQKNKNQDFVSSVQRGNAFKLGPNQYNVLDQNGFVSTENLKKVKFALSKAERISFLGEIVKKKAWVPAPSAYKIVNNEKTKGNYLLKEPLCGMFTEATYRGQATPSFHNQIELEKVRKTSRKPDFSLSKTVRMHQLKKTAAGDSETSPHSYNPDLSAKKTEKSSPRYSYGKEKNKGVIQSYATAKNWVPGPSTYELDKAYTRITIGARRGYK